MTEPIELELPGSALVERRFQAIVAHRMSAWLWISVGLLVAVFFTARHQLSVVLFKLTLMTIGGYLGYVLSLAAEGALRGSDRAKRPHEYRADAAELRASVTIDDPHYAEVHALAWQWEQLAAAMLWRRAMICSAALLAAAFGG